jgi:NAD(P)-dependent dehydrogenase (short-subunit alcohol dehydrogenase family)
MPRPSRAGTGLATPAALGEWSTTTDVVRSVDLTGRRAIVTGATAGLGLESARALAAAGARVVLAGRDPGRLARAEEEIERAAPGALVDALVCDLASLASVRRATEEVRASGEALDLLVNNAGVTPRSLGPVTEAPRTLEGFELSLGTNHLGHFLLTCRLAPLLLEHGGRVINVGSGAHRDSSMRWEDPHYLRRPYDVREAYGQSKTANALFTLGLERRLGNRGVHAFTVRPGATSPGASNERPELVEAASRGKRRYPVEVAAATTVWACTAPELDAHGAAYLYRCRVVAEPGAPGSADDHAPWIFDEDAAERLWAWSEEQVGEHFALGAPR